MKHWKFISLFTMALVSYLFLLQAGAGEKRVVRDMVGRKVVVREKAERIITTFKPAALCLLSLGLCDRLVGIDSHSKHDKLQLGVYPGIADLPPVGRKSTGLNLETIMHLKPDLVLLYAQKDGIKIADRLVKYGIPALVILPETFEGLNRTLMLIAEAVGEPARAARVMSESNRLLSFVAGKVRQVPEEERKIVYYASSEGVFSTATGSLLQDEIISRAGGVNAGHELSGYFREISPEQFIQWDPDLVAASLSARAQAARVLSRPEFKQVKAVANGEVYLFPSNLAPWDFPSPLSTLGVLWLGKRLYPERFEDLDVIAEIDRFHQVLFKKSFTAMEGELKDRLE